MKSITGLFLLENRFARVSSVHSLFGLAGWGFAFAPRRKTRHLGTNRKGPFLYCLHHQCQQILFYPKRSISASVLHTRRWSLLST
ncbi:hypothetical protein CEXT_442371 [Caerostris extrusa]|uniref:Secreted protein n=1 Tax=Caerostris extrusa TaxID=172846 RepID=A0AAV4MM12_CAEEX|nr:hypothetical protein CEXT_442371 [Caerostris extrusa]